ncbi:bifunctional diaminohydroxyphosphoribosylaminopyrimidine deaminase/5-amino-6-(5-phosphoribosylamino)uracil reductase RibD [Psittacicella gerlachiana]|uniref:Riboflavin biosynthesis protein RibD n=1 Tax=Psittacicella gerlachiana TaxID=2028574 RepID=A0A3A1Y847_9GAMM|nr:bifunctional diaminohydroxyphosphoribosylaminopyrimidine deaminase/5-amino-6-(5-phosphoribosylamino)uracil reductase RibD [Psittacicella gerlachiana]RIY33399.1 riboflavin biosynthesis protein RibD [Psittacicella gerlachiana]
MSFAQELDIYYQDLAYNLALKGKISCYPNPAVGCVIVKDQCIISCGYHQFAGTAHAERAAVLDLQQRYPQTWQELIKDAQVYVTLEPCAHFGRTPPCANLLVDCQVGEVIYLASDTTAKVNGKGVAVLEQGGIKVRYVPRDTAQNLNRDFFALQESRDLPYVKIKIGASLDSKVALPNGESKWITSPQARSYVQALRWQADAILTSSKTIIRDQAKYNVRYEELPETIQKHLPQEQLKQPKVVILDNSFALQGKETIFSSQAFENLIIISKDEHPLKELYPQIHFLNSVNSHTAQGLKEILSKLKQLEINNLLIEAGSSLTNAFIDAKLFEQLHYFVAPKVLGQGIEALHSSIVKEQIDQSLSLKLLYSQTLSEDNLYLVYEK